MRQTHSGYFRVELALRFWTKIELGAYLTPRISTRGDWTIAITLPFWRWSFGFFAAAVSPRPRPRPRPRASSLKLQHRKSHTHSPAIIGLTLFWNDDRCLSPASIQ